MAGKGKPRTAIYLTSDKRHNLTG